MTRLGGVRGGGGGGGAVGGRGMGGPATVDIKSLPIELQLAFEMIQSLRVDDPAGRKVVVETAGATEPVGVNGLKAIADLYALLDMPLSHKGVARFKADRGLPGGPQIIGPTAKAYARALHGNEIVVRVDRGEEAALSGPEKATLRVLRAYAKARGADQLAPIKRALSLNNPPMSETAQRLQNEWVGVAGVKDIARAATLQNVALTLEGFDAWSQKLAEAKPAATTSTTAPRKPPQKG